MFEHQFDLLTKRVAHAATRRDALRLLTGVTAGGLTALLGVPEYEAGEAERRKKAGKKNRKQQRKRERKKERRRARRQSHKPQSPPTGPTEPTEPSGPCEDDTKLCDGACIPSGDCCTNQDCDGAQVCRDGACGAPSLYPNLRTKPVSDIAFDTHPDPDKEGTYILRFGNTVWNAGEGRLELESEVDPTDPNPKPIYQNLYDAPVGGNLTERKLVASDFIWHPQHNHFHFKDFAEYLLLGRDTNGDYLRLKTEGIKTSFCVMDTQRFAGDLPSQYDTCNADRQGLTPGWSDTYRYSLYDQWIVLGDQILPDGEYAVQSTADPRGVIDEGGGDRETDNAAIKYFTVDGGEIGNERDQP